MFSLFDVYPLSAVTKPIQSCLLVFMWVFFVLLLWPLPLVPLVLPVGVVVVVVLLGVFPPVLPAVWTVVVAVAVVRVVVAAAGSMTYPLLLIYQRTFSIHLLSINPFSKFTIQLTLSTHPLNPSLNPPSQPTFSTHSLNPPSWPIFTISLAIWTIG